MSRSQISLRFGKGSRAAALLIALCFLVLLSAVVLALFATSRADRQNASVFATGQETLRLADAAVNLVQGQVRDATIQPRVGWASQPGLVRSFGQDGTVTAYKLYSSDQMVVSGYGKSQIDAETAAMQSWNIGATDKSFNALYADLNSPAVVKRPDPSNPSQTIDTPVFPVADPAAIGAVEGFSATTSVPGTVLSTGVTRRLPMPVRWIYVLRDGQMIAPSGGDSARVTFSGAVVPTRENPIVGRLAFWADDDTSKLNINTASEGAFWDVPKANTRSEVRMAISMPVQGEFQRVVGHPATTSLSPVLSSISAAYVPPGNLIDSTTISSAVADPDGHYRNLVNYYTLTPRISGSLGASDRSSKGGAQRTSAVGRAGTSEEVNNNVWPTSDQTEYRKGAPILPDSDRLYATVDELLFNPLRTRNLDLTNTEVAKRDFFLTASSRAPESTLFGTPRISLWPQQSSANDQNVKDRLIGFCASVGKDASNNPYIYSFQRGIGAGGLYTAAQPADSPTTDISIPRNGRLLNMLRNLGSIEIPGYGGRLSSKWGNEGVDKVLAQTFDTIRSAINTDYVNLGGKIYRYAVTTMSPRTAVTAGANGTLEDQSSGPRGYVIPAKLSDSARGAGRSLSISQFALVFMASKVESDIEVTWKPNPASNPPVPKEVYQQIADGESITPQPTKTGYEIASTKVVGQRTLEVRAFLIFQPYLGTQGTPIVAPGGEIEIIGLDSLRINGVAMVPTGSVSTRFGSYHWQNNRASGTTHALGTFQIFANYANPASQVGNKTSGGYPADTFFKEAKHGGTDKNRDYPFVSPSVPVAGSTINFSGGNFSVRLKTWRDAEEYQRFEVTMPPATFVVPQHVGTDTLFASGDFNPITYPLQSPPADSGWQQGNYLSVRKRLIGNANSANNMNTLMVIRPGDVVCSVELDPTDPAVRGDFRILALSPVVSAFRPVAGYGTASTPYPGLTKNNNDPLQGRFAHSLRTESGSVSQYGFSEQYGWKAGNGGNLENRNSSDSTGSASTLVAGVPFTTHAAPIVAAGLIGARLADGSIGDWQSGIGADKDGAFFSRPDPGDSNKGFGGYFGDKYTVRANAGDTFEPNRSVPSAGILGGLLTTDGAGSLQPWQTLLFNPVPAAGSSHPGYRSPPDHLFLDNFWMPAVEPYPISEPLSTAGKVNLNFEMAPFSHIERSTAFRGALVPLMISGVENADAGSGQTYKYGEYDQPVSAKIRHNIDRDETVQSMRNRFASGDFFRSATSVAEILLVPEGESASSVTSWWNNRRISSDTMREQPYSALLSRVTTKSNTFTVHYRVQALRQPVRPGRDWAEWDEARDQVVGEYRGSTTIERFLDPNAQNIPDYTQVDLSGTYDPIDRWYRWRVVSQKQFAP